VAVSTAPCSFSRSTLGDNGNVDQVVNNRAGTRTEAFTYDSLNRIASAQSSGSQWGETFNIDSWGNLTGETGITGKTNHESLNTTAGINNQLAGFGYDAAGNMTSNGSTSYVYDGENRLVWTSGYRYFYDGNGERVEKCVAATSTTACPTSGTNGTLYWKGTGSDPQVETDLSGNALEQYAFFNGQRIARRDISSNAVHYYFSDHLGSHGVIENATATACEQDIDYYPYGGVQNDYCPNVAQNYKFTGKERDGESGLDYFGARHHASALGRFMSADSVLADQHPGSPQSWNLYPYGANNPLRNKDLNGRGVIDVQALVQGVSNWFTSGVARDGGVGKFAQNNAIGAAKGAGTFGVNTLKTAGAAILASQNNVAGGASLLTSSNPSALQPSNTTQARRQRQPRSGSRWRR
jgi:RHS repeat-associated protein